MILSNREIINAINRGALTIDGLAGTDPTQGTVQHQSTSDLRLGKEINVLEGAPVALDLTKYRIAGYWAKHSKKKKLEDDQGCTLKPNKLIVTNT